MNNAQLAQAAPSIFAADASARRSARYAYIPTIDVIDGMRGEGFQPVFVSEAKSADRLHAKHLIRFRRTEDINTRAAECRDVVLINSHDGSSTYRLMAGVYRFCCANGLIVGQTDNEIRVRHSGDAVSKVIEGAYSIVRDFDDVGTQIEAMKAITLAPEQATAFAKAALAVRFPDVANCGFTADRVLRPRRTEDTGSDLWTRLNVVQEHLTRGGMRGYKHDALGRTKRVKAREIKGIDQSTAVNRGLWVLAEEMRKLTA